MQRVREAIDERVAEDHEFAAILELQLKSGRRESVRIDIASGKPGNWLTAEVLKAKFFDCLGVTGEAASGQQLFDHSRALAGAQSVSDLTDALARSCARAATGGS
jgi:2-methylcitrate dehydratase PrpD